MKKLYKIPWQCCRGLKKAAITAVLLFGATQIVSAQVNAYYFTQSSGTFTSISTTGTVVTGSEATTSTTNDTNGWDVTIPFSFNFNGANYTSIYVNSNGGTTFGTTNTGAALISATTAYSGAISVMNRDLWGVFITSGVTTSGSNLITNVVSMQGIEVGKTLNAVNGIPTGATITAFDEVAGTITMSANATSSSATAVVRYGTGKILTSTIGTAPNRTFIVEWIGYNDYNTGASGSNYLNFQLRLAETTNSISTVYGPQYNVNTLSRTNQIGLRGATNADFNNRTGAVANPWTSTTAGMSNSATVSRDDTNFPASGLTFTWNVPTCYPPTVPVFSNFTTSSADVSFTAASPAPANGYEVYYSAYSNSSVSPDGTTVLTPMNSVSTTSTTASLTGLSSGTTYNVWIRSVCSPTDSSSWIYAGPLTTLCNVFTVPYTENFDNTATGSSTNTNAPNCWTYLETAGSAGYGYVTTTNNSAPNGYYLYNSSDNSGNMMLVSPQTTNLSDGTRRVKFFARSSTAGYPIQIGTVSSNSDPATFTLISSIALTTTHTQYIVNIPAGTDAYIAFKHGLGGTFRTIYLDDVTVENIPSCLAPTLLNLTGATYSSLDVAWTAPSTAPANGYQVYYSTTNTAPTAATVLDGTNSVTSATTSATISGLTANTVYYVWVRSNCAAADQSTWVGPLSANAGYCLPSGGASSTSYYLNNITTTLGTTNIAYTASSYTAFVNNSTSTFSSYPGSTVNAALSSSGGSTYYYYTWVDWNNDLDFNDVGETIIATTTYAATASAAIAVPAMQALGDYRVRFASSYSGAITACGPAPYGNYVDYTLTVAAAPSCTAPTSVVISNVSTTSADVAWTAPATAPANGYEVYYSTNNTAPTSTTVLDGTNSVTSATTSATISGLMASTTYYVWVRSSCSASDKSIWSAVSTFTTVCSAVSVPYMVDFETASVGGTAPCTTLENAGTGNNWAVKSNNGYGFTTKALVYTYNSSNAANAWFYTNGLDLPVGEYTISYDYGSTSFPEKLKVAYGTSASSASMTNVIATYNPVTPTSVANSAAIDVTITTAGTYYFGFNAFSDADEFYLTIDNISVVAKTLGTVNLTKDDKGVNIYPNPFTDFIRISDVKDVVSVSIVDMSGRLVKTMKPASELNLGDLKSGMYLINLTMKDGSVKTVKSIKK